MNGHVFTKNIYVSAEDGIGFIVPKNFEVQGPMSRNYDCTDPVLSVNCKRYHEYDVRNPNDEHHDYIVLGVYSEIPKGNDKPTISVGDKTITFIIGDGFKTFDVIKSTISKIREVNMGDCKCDLCSGSCAKPTNEMILSGVPPAENYAYCANNYCVDVGESCTPVSYEILKRDYLVKNIIAVLKSNF